MMMMMSLMQTFGFCVTGERIAETIDVQTDGVPVPMSATRTIHLADVTMNQHVVPTHYFPPGMTSTQHFPHFPVPPVHLQSRHPLPRAGLLPQQEHEQALFTMMRHRHRHELPTSQQVNTVVLRVLLYTVLPVRCRVIIIIITTTTIICILYSHCPISCLLKLFSYSDWEF